MSIAMRILVTPRSLTATPHPLVEAMRAEGYDIIYCTAGALPAEEELLDLVPDCEGWLAGIEPVSERVVAAAQSLRVIARNGIGTDNLPLAALAARGITIDVAAGANARGVAELTLALMLNALRHIPATDAGIKAGGWPRIVGREIADATVGVIGAGAVGGEVARLSAAIGARVMVCDPIRRDLQIEPERLSWVALDTLLAGSDIVSLHCPPLPGRTLVDADALASMRPGAVLVNTARASLVDETAVVAALESGRLGAYAVDVFAEEPPASLALVRHPRVIATSHIGGLTVESVERATRHATETLRKALSPSPVA